MQFSRLNALPLVAVLSLVGCAHAFPTDTEHLASAIRSVHERTPFDLGCDDAAVAKLGDVTRLGQQATRTNIGATCGDRRATYSVTCISNWGDITCSAEANTTQTDA